MNDKEHRSIDALFKPKNIAIYEAKDKLYYFIKGFVEFGFPLNSLYLISSTEKELFGVKCYKTIDDIPTDSIDLFIVAVRRELLTATLKEILKKKQIRFIHFFSAGGGETDEIGAQIESELKEILRSTNGHTRAIGPNCMGVYCPLGKNTYSPSFSKEPGNIGLIYHSGDLHSKTVVYGSFKHNLRYSKGVSIGNCVDLQIFDFLNYFNADNETDFVCVYFEGFSRLYKNEGIRLFHALKTMSKPILLIRGGRTRRAQAAVSSHTGSLGSDQKIWRGIFQQTPTVDAGIGLDDLLDCAAIFNMFFKKYRNLPKEKQLELYPKTKNALVIIWSGGLGVLDTDALTDLGINLPNFEGNAKKKLMDAYPLKIGSLSNPLDLPWIVHEQMFVNICKAGASGDVDLIIIESDSPLHWDTERFEKYYANLNQIKAYVETLNKILVVILPEYPHSIRLEYHQRLLKDGFTVYSSVTSAGKSFLGLYEYGQKLKALNKI